MLWWNRIIAGRDARLRKGQPEGVAKEDGLAQPHVIHWLFGAPHEEGNRLRRVHQPGWHRMGMNTPCPRRPSGSRDAGWPMG
jgi:hypothetical protein